MKIFAEQRTKTTEPEITEEIEGTVIFTMALPSLAKERKQVFNKLMKKDDIAYVHHGI